MSQPRHAKRGDIPRAVPPPTRAVTPPAPDDVRVAGKVRNLHAVPDPLPAPEPDEPAASSAGGPVCKLSEFELSLATPGDPDFLPGAAHSDLLLDQDFYRWLEFDKAIDREPEIE